MGPSRTEAQVEAALAAIEAEAATILEKVEMLMEIAVGLQMRPKSIEDLRSALQLYDEALRLCPSEERAISARLIARKGTALQAMPGETSESLEAARDCFVAAGEALRADGSAEELAEIEMNLGLVLQSLAAMGRARVTDAISAYQRALRTFNKHAHPKEFAILQNNLATAFIAIPFSDERAKMREALAVQAFEEGLRVVNLIDHPTEYAMLQNNLGNALQYASSSHAVENNLRALQAYDEALKVRTRATTPLEYANTIANKANCLWNLPDQPEQPDLGNPANLKLAIALYREALDIFDQRGETAKAKMISEALQQASAELRTPSGRGGNGAATEAELSIN
ncbi:MAG: hypothetical protein R3D05_00725 [Dongiaceae bacterium]